jgi:threonylcarbamoyladenosine tRNA methylthiotransferase MtaB
LRKLINLGCKLNQYEGYCLLKKFSGLDDLVIVNTCCVTREAEKKSLKKLKQAIKKYPKAEIIATGCACRIAPEKFRRAHKVIDNVERIELIENILPEPNKSRYFLKIQDGCNGRCTFCIVAKVRATIKSKTLMDIVEEIAWANALGYKEIVLVGANIGLYGIDLDLSLTDLLREIAGIKDLPRVRLSSVEPQFVNDELIAVLRDLPFCRHFHIPIQSADDRILGGMGRGYDASHLGKIIELISKNFSDAAISGDVIVGFPGEGEEEFLNTYNFLAASCFTHLHVFPYSPRPGTEAYELGDPIPGDVKNERLWRLKNLIAEKNYKFRLGLIGKDFGTIIEERIGPSSIGLTDNYCRVMIDSRQGKNALVRVRITTVTEKATAGTIAGCE